MTDEGRVWLRAIVHEAWTGKPLDPDAATPAMIARCERVAERVAQAIVDATHDGRWAPAIPDDSVIVKATHAGVAATALGFLIDDCPAVIEDGCAHAREAYRAIKNEYDRWIPHRSLRTTREGTNG